MDEELKRKIIEIRDIMESIDYDINSTIQDIYELEETIEESNKNCIKDINDFKRELKRDGLYSEKLEEFIDNYLRFYNK